MAAQDPNIELIEQLRQEHRDLDDAIRSLEEVTIKDQLQIKRLKKRKLRLRDQIAVLKDLMHPDIIA